MADLVHKYLTTKVLLDFYKCRGQSYDNAANIVGRCNGMQQKVLEGKKFAKFIPMRWPLLKFGGPLSC